MKKKQKSVKLKRLKVPILNNEYFVYVLWGNVDKALQFMKSYYGDKTLTKDMFNGCRGRTFYCEGCYPVIWVNTKIHFYASLAHEATHAINYIWEQIGEKVKDEVYGHSVGAIVREVCKLKRKKRT